jgi:ABC-type sulfate/molybdate transport systems ATPase subunit
LTLQSIAGLVTPDVGRIRLNGRLLFDSKNHVCLTPVERHIGMVFQDYALFPHLTARENIEFGLDRLPAEERQSGLANGRARCGSSRCFTVTLARSPAARNSESR